MEARPEVEQQPGTGAPHPGARRAERLEPPHHLVDGCRLGGMSLDDRMGRRRFDAADGEQTQNEDAPRSQRQAGEERCQPRGEWFDGQNSDTIDTAELSKQLADRYVTGKSSPGAPVAPRCPHRVSQGV